MHVIEFKEDGTAECLHTEEIPLGELGSLRMKRASSIDWIEADQYWGVFINGRLHMLNPSRQTCLDYERQYFNDMILRR